MNTLKNWSLEIVEKSLEGITYWSVGQTLIEQTDKLLWVFEKSTEWSVPISQDVKKEVVEPQNNCSNSNQMVQPKLTRPLPWVLFLPVLLTLRALRFLINFSLNFIGYEPLTPIEIIEIIQNIRRKLRTAKYQANLITSERKNRIKFNTERKNTSFIIPIRNSIQNIFCFSSRNLKFKADLNVQKITFASKQFSDVLNNSQIALKKLIENSSFENGLSKTKATQTQMVGEHLFGKTTKSSVCLDIDVRNCNYLVDEFHSTESIQLSDYEDMEENISEKHLNMSKPIEENNFKNLNDFANNNELLENANNNIENEEFFSPINSVCSTPEPKKCTQINIINSSTSEPSKLPTASNKNLRANNNVNTSQKGNFHLKNHNLSGEKIDSKNFKKTSYEITDHYNMKAKDGNVTSATKLQTIKLSKKVNKKASSTSNLSYNIPISQSINKKPKDRN